MPPTNFHLKQTLLLFTLSTLSLAVSKTPGCGQTHTGIGQTKRFTIPSSGSPPDREFYVHLPENYDLQNPTPMIVAFHGYKRDWSDMEEISRFSEKEINPNMIVVYPNGVVNPDGYHAWEGAPYAVPTVSDKVFTTDLLNYMRSNYCIDNTRIYASGKSNGGGFVNTLACSPDHGGDFAAFAPVSAALYTEAGNGSNCAPAREQMPILEFHGTDDETIKYGGGVSHGVTLPSIPDWLARWAVRNGCPNPPTATTEDMADGVHVISYSCDGVDNVVSGYKIDGQGHWWPSMVTNNDNKGVTAPIEASRVIIEFFNGNVNP